MSETDNTTMKPIFSGVVFHAGSGFVLLLISSVLTFFPLFENVPPDWTNTDTGLAAALLCVCWGLTVSCFACCSRRPWSRRLGECSGTFALLAFMCFLTTVSLKEFAGARQMPPRGTATVGVLLLLNSAIGLFLFLSAKRGAGESGEKADDIMASPRAIVIWPLLMLGVSPIGVLLYLVMVGGIAYLGEWIGGKYSHPLLGSLCSAGGLLVLIGALILIVPNKKRNDDKRMQATN